MNELKRWAYLNVDDEYLIWTVWTSVKQLSSISHSTAAWKKKFSVRTQETLQQNKYNWNQFLARISAISRIEILDRVVVLWKICDIFQELSALHGWRHRRVHWRTLRRGLFNCFRWSLSRCKTKQIKGVVEIKGQRCDSCCSYCDDHIEAYLTKGNISECTSLVLVSFVCMSVVVCGRLSVYRNGTMNNTFSYL